MKDLAEKKCVACEGTEDPLKVGEITAFQKRLTQQWEVESNHHITQEFSFDDFKKAMQFVNNVADIAESEGHHPDISIFYNKVQLKLYTHAIDGLHENDFIMAEKINKLVTNNT